MMVGPLLVALLFTARALPARQLLFWWSWSRPCACIAAVGTFLILKFVNLFVPLRVQEEEELLGLDISQHGEPAYAL